MDTRRRIFLFVLLLFVVPALVTTAMLASSQKDETLDGPQPGGVIRGDVRDRTGKAIPDVDVEVFAIGADGQRRRLGVVRSEATGAFEVVVEPVRGHYELRASAAEWVEQRRDVTQLDRNGAPVAGKPVTFALEEAGRLDVEFTRRQGRGVASGTWALLVPGRASLLGSEGQPARRTGRFEAGRVEIGGLQPGRVRFQAHLTTGERVDVVLDLAPGRNHHKVEL